MKYGLDFFVRTLYIKCAHIKGGEQMSPSQGRPRIENPKTDRLFIRVTPEEKEAIHSFAKESGKTLLELIYKGIEAVKKEK